LAKRQPAGKQLREEFDRDEGSFLAYVGALHERNRGRLERGEGSVGLV
jgi:hypothetical protein